VISFCVSSAFVDRALLNQVNDPRNLTNQEQTNFAGLDFDDDLSETDKVCDVFFLKFQSFVLNPQWLLRLERYVPSTKLNLQRFLIDWLKKSATKCVPDIHRRAHDAVNLFL